MSYIVKCNFKDFAGSGWFAIGTNAQGPCVTWGYSENTSHFRTRAEAQTKADELNAIDAAKKDHNPSACKWTVLDMAGE